MTYKHKRTGDIITTEQLKSMLEEGCVAVFVSDYNICAKEPAPVYSYRIKDIPFSEDWEEVSTSVALSTKELEVLVGALGYSGLANADEEIGDIASKLTKHLHKVKHNFEFIEG